MSSELSNTQKVAYFGVGFASGVLSLAAYTLGSYAWNLINRDSDTCDHDQADDQFLTLSSSSSSKRTRNKRFSRAAPEGSQRPCIRAVSFDMDGTLIRTDLVWYNLLRDACHEFNYPEFTYEHWIPYFGQSMEANVVNFFPNLDVSKLDKYCIDNFSKYLNLIEALPGAVDALRFSHDSTGGNVYIITNCPRPIFEMTFTSPAMDAMKEYLVNADGTYRVICAGDTLPSSDDVPIAIGKPSPCMLQVVAHRLNISTHEMIMVGDSKFDIEAAVNAGSIGIIYERDNDDAYIRINHLSELCQLQNSFEFTPFDTSSIAVSQYEMPNL